MRSVTAHYGVRLFTDTLLKTANNPARDCTHYTIDYDAFVHPPLQDTEKVIVYNIDTSIYSCWLSMNKSLQFHVQYSQVQ